MAHGRNKQGTSPAFVVFNVSVIIGQNKSTGRESRVRQTRLGNRKRPRRHKDECGLDMVARALWGSSGEVMHMVGDERGMGVYQQAPYPYAMLEEVIRMTEKQRSGKASSAAVA